MRAGITAGAGGAFPGLGQAGAGNARLEARGLRLRLGRAFAGSCALAASQEAWPGAERKGREPPGKSRGGTPTGERVPLDARRIRGCGQGHHASAGVPLPFFCSPDGAERNPGSEFELLRSFPDCAALHPGYGVCKNSGASAPRERWRLSAPARSAGEGDHAKHGGGGVLSRGFFSDGGASLTAARPYRRASRATSPALRGRTPSAGFVRSIRRR